MNAIQVGNNVFAVDSIRRIALYCRETNLSKPPKKCEACGRRPRPEDWPAESAVVIYFSDDTDRTFFGEEAEAIRRWVADRRENAAGQGIAVLAEPDPSRIIASSEAWQSDQNAVRGLAPDA